MQIEKLYEIKRLTREVRTGVDLAADDAERLALLLYAASTTQDADRAARYVANLQIQVINPSITNIDNAIARLNDLKTEIETLGSNIKCTVSCD